MEIYSFHKDNIMGGGFPRFVLGNINYYYHINNFAFKTLHGHSDYWEFTIITNGSITNVSNNKNETYQPGTLFWQTTKDCHFLTNPDSSTSVRYINIMVREKTILPMAKSFSKNFLDRLMNGEHSIHIDNGTINEIENIIHKANMLIRDDADKFNNVLCSGVVLLLQRIFSSSLTEYAEHKFVKQIHALMNDVNFLQYNVSDLAAKTGYSRMQLDRLMREHFSQTPHQFITMNRLKYAESLLLSTDMPVKEICTLVGYSGFPVFVKNFTEQFGVTPLKYRSSANKD